MNLISFKRKLGMGLILGAAFVAMEYVVNGYLLSGLYKGSAEVWRVQEEMQSRFGFLIFAQLLFGTMFGTVYAQGYEPRREPLGQGFRYGLIMAFMIAPMSTLAWYVLLPVPSKLAVAWFVCGFAELILLGFLASFLYRPAD